MERFKNIDFDSFKILKNIQRKIKKKRNRKKNSLRAFKYLKRHKKILLIFLFVFILIIILSIVLFYPSYRSDFIKKSKSIYDDLQSYQSTDLKNVFTADVTDETQQNVLSHAQLDQVQKKVDGFKSKINTKCKELSIAIFTASDLGNKLNKYCDSIISATTQTMEIVDVNKLIADMNNFSSVMSNVSTSDSLFKELKINYDQILSTTRQSVANVKYTNSSFINLQTNTNIFINQVNDLYKSLINEPKDFNGGGSGDSTYKQKLSDLYQSWRNQIPTIIESVSSDIATNVNDSAKDFLDEYNKLSTGVSSNPSDKIAPSILKTN